MPVILTVLWRKLTNVAVPKGRVQNLTSSSLAAEVDLDDDFSLSDEEAACLIGAGVSAWNAVFGGKPPKPGDLVLCQGDCVYSVGINSCR